MLEVGMVGQKDFETIRRFNGGNKRYTKTDQNEKKGT